MNIGKNSLVFDYEHIIMASMGAIAVNLKWRRCFFNARTKKKSSAQTLALETIDLQSFMNAELSFNVCFFLSQSWYAKCRAKDRRSL